MTICTNDHLCLESTYRIIRTVLKATGRKSTPKLSRALQQHLSQPRLLRKLLDVDLRSSTDITGTPGPGSEVIVPVPRSNDYASYRRRTWMALDIIHCRESTGCQRRGCTNKGLMRCKACSKNRYCGVQCQRRLVVLAAASSRF